MVWSENHQKPRVFFILELKSKTQSFFHGLGSIVVRYGRNLEE